MQLSNLPKTVDLSKRRVGRGHGSGRGKTAGRGTKGQKARGTIPLGFEGGQLALAKRLPLYRGKSRNGPQTPKSVIVTLSDLDKLPAKSVVNKEALVKAGILEKSETFGRIKIVNNGSLSVVLTVNIPVSKGAAAKIEKAGGTIVSEDQASVLTHVPSKKTPQTQPILASSSKRAAGTKNSAK